MNSFSVRISNCTEKEFTLSYYHNGIPLTSVIVSKENGHLKAHLNTVYYDKALPTGMGYGAKAFARLVVKLAEKDKKAIVTMHAVGEGEAYDPIEEENGFYTWPRLGANGEIDYGEIAKVLMFVERPIPGLGLITKPSKESIEKIKKFFGGAKLVSDLMATKEGRAKWQKYGAAILCKFTVAEGTYSREVLKGYIREKGFDLN